MHVSHALHGPWSTRRRSKARSRRRRKSSGHVASTLFKSIAMGAAIVGLSIFAAFPMALFALVALPVWLFMKPGLGMSAFGRPVEADEEEPLEDEP